MDILGVSLILCFLSDKPPGGARIGLLVKSMTLEEEEESEIEGMVIDLGTPWWIVSFTTERVKYLWLGRRDFLAPDEEVD